MTLTAPLSRLGVASRRLASELIRGEDAERQHVRPVYRRAVLLDIQPQPDRERAFELARALRSAWPDVEGEYRHVLEGLGLREITARPPRTSGATFDDVFEDRKTIVLNLPALLVRTRGGLNLDHRITIALCTGKLHAKVWSRWRVAAPFDQPIRLSELADYLEDHRRWGERTSEWAARWARQVLHRWAEEMLDAEGGTEEALRIEPAEFGLELVTLGTDDPIVRDYTVTLDVMDAASPSDLLLTDDVTEHLERFLRPVRPISLVDVAVNDKGLLAVSPVEVMGSDGFLDRRKLLYVTTSTQELVQTVGLGYDGERAPDEDLAKVSSILVARWIAERL